MKQHRRHNRKQKRHQLSFLGEFIGKQADGHCYRLTHSVHIEGKKSQADINGQRQRNILGVAVNKSARCKGHPQGADGNGHLPILEHPAKEPHKVIEACLRKQKTISGQVQIIVVPEGTVVL